MLESRFCRGEPCRRTWGRTTDRAAYDLEAGPGAERGRSGMGGIGIVHGPMLHRFPRGGWAAGESGRPSRAREPPPAW